MTGIHWAGLSITVALFFYLLTALVRPEKF